MLDLLFVVAGTLVLAVFLTVFITAIRLSRLRLRPMDSRKIDLTRVPAASRAILDLGRAWLVERGFRYESSWVMRPLIVTGKDNLRFSDVYVDASGTVFAGVGMRENPQPGDLAMIEFSSVYADGTMLTTVNRHRHGVIWEPRWWKVDDGYEASYDAVLKRHRSRMEGEGGQASADIGYRDELATRHLRAYVDALVESRRAARAADGEVRMRFLPSIAYVWKLLRGNMRAAAVTPVPLAQAQAASAAPGAAPSHDAGVEADLQAYQARRAVVGATSSKGKWQMGLVSAAAFIAVGAWLWDWAFAVAVLLVIALHEGGHYLAMKAVGYRNLHVFFVPGLGGLATGEKQDATVWQKVLVYLAGPVPGIVIATALLIALPDEALATIDGLSRLLWIMLVINVINLLPVTPLDGGRVMEVLFFTRWPTLRFAFALVCCLALLAFGAAFGETVMLIIGILVALSLPSQWRFSRLSRRIPRPAGEAYDEHTSARKVFTALAAAPFSSWSFQKRAVAADELIAELRTPLAGFGAMIGGLAIYVACFVAPAASALAASEGVRETVAALWEVRGMWSEARDAQGRRAADPGRDWAAEIAAARDAPAERRLALLVEAGEAGYSAATDQASIKRHVAELRTLAGSISPGHPARGKGLLHAIELDHEAADRPAMLEGVHAEFRGATGEGAEVRGRAGMALAHSIEAPARRLELMQESRDALRGSVAASNPHLVDAWSVLARELGKQGDATAAEAEWKTLLAALGPAPEDPLAIGARTSVEMGYMAFLLQQKRLADVEALVAPAIDRAIAQPDAKRWRLMAHMPQMQVLAWLAILRGDATAAKSRLDAWERAASAGTGRRNPNLALARLGAAEVAGDAQAVESARAHLASLPGKATLCERPVIPMFEGSPISDHAVRLIERHGVCGKAA